MLCLVCLAFLLQVVWGCKILQFHQQQTIVRTQLYCCTTSTITVALQANLPSQIGIVALMIELFGLISLPICQLFVEFVISRSYSIPCQTSRIQNTLFIKRVVDS